MAYQPMKSRDGWFVIDDETGEPVNKDPLKSKAEALKLIQTMEVSKSMAPAAAGGPPQMDMGMPMQAGMGAPPNMPPGMPNVMAGQAPTPQMMAEMMRKKSNALPNPMAR